MWKRANNVLRFDTSKCSCWDATIGQYVGMFPKFRSFKVLALNFEYSGSGQDRRFHHGRCLAAFLVPRDSRPHGKLRVRLQPRMFPMPKHRLGVRRADDEAGCSSALRRPVLGLHGPLRIKGQERGWRIYVGERECERPMGQALSRTSRAGYVVCVVARP